MTCACISDNGTKPPLGRYLQLFDELCRIWHPKAKAPLNAIVVEAGSHGPGSVGENT